MMETRKKLRLGEFDYSQNGAYFITVCSKNREHIFSRIVVGRDDLGAPKTELSPIGKTVEKYILSINEAYENVSLDLFTIMPNHIHLMLRIDSNGAPGSSRPTVSNIIGALKRFTNKEIGRNVWQTSFYDHVIRGEQDYIIRAEYIENNPARWAEDEYYS